jgi:hypothetical protein
MDIKLIDVESPLCWFYEKLRVDLHTKVLYDLTHFGDSLVHCLEECMRRLLMILGIAVLMVPVFLAACSIFIAIAQVRVANDDQRIIQKMRFKNSRIDEPVEIVEITANGQNISVDTMFYDKGDWLKDLTIKFKNVSKKTITHLDWNLLFPETKTSTPPLSHSMTYGLYYSKQAPDAPGMKYLAPGEIAIVKLDDESYQRMKKFVGRKSDVSNLNLVTLTLLVVYFDDGMQWSAGSLFRPDPSRPGKFVLDSKN